MSFVLHLPTRRVGLSLLATPSDDRSCQSCFFCVEMSRMCGQARGSISLWFRFLESARACAHHIAVTQHRRVATGLSHAATHTGRLICNVGHDGHCSCDSLGCCLQWCTHAKSGTLDRPCTRPSPRVHAFIQRCTVAPPQTIILLSRVAAHCLRNC